MAPVSLLRQQRYSMDWVRDFYTQAGKWWGPDVAEEACHQARADAVERLCGPGSKRILELGAGSCRSAAAMADRGHDVTAVEFNPTDVRYAQDLLKVRRAGSLRVLEADFYAVELEGRFDAVCYWDGFGVGSDADHRRLLRRIAHDWLAPGGSALVDVFSPIRPARDDGKEERLEALEGVPESVEMIRRCHFDPVHCRWIDEWVPVADPEQSLAQTARCYTPADLVLLLEGTGLALRRIEVDGGPVEFEGERITLSGALMQAWSYLAQLVLAVEAQSTPR